MTVRSPHIHDATQVIFDTKVVTRRNDPLRGSATNRGSTQAISGESLEVFPEVLAERFLELIQNISYMYILLFLTYIYIYIFKKY